MSTDRKNLWTNLAAAGMAVFGGLAIWHDVISDRWGSLLIVIAVGFLFGIYQFSLGPIDVGGDS